MLKYLRVQNLAIIHEISIEFSAGLTVVTGETGAGKSILVDSLSLLLGERAGGERVRSGEENGAVEAVFDLSRQEGLPEFAEERGWTPEGGELILRREIQAGGRGRAFVGSRLASLADLRGLGERLVDLHGQHEHQALLRPAEHLPILDRFGEHRPAVEKLAELHDEIRKSRARLDSLRRDRQEIARRVDLLRFQVEEIERAALRPDEGETLKAERHRLRNQERIRELALSALDRLYEGEGAALADLDGVLASGRELSRLDPRVSAPLARAEEAKPILKDLADALREAGREREEAPARLEEVEQRLSLLDGLIRKYGPDEAAVGKFRDRAIRELEELTSAEGCSEGLEARLGELAAEFSREAAALSLKRQRAARALEKGVKAELAEVAMEGTDFEVELRTQEEPDSLVRNGDVPVAFDASGWDRVRFLIRTNPGEPLRPLSRIASGGELSRIMLAVHLVLHRGEDRTVRVFDEVDAGIGGRVAEAVGRKLKSLSRGGQVLCVTHLPQIASLADQHLLVSKHLRSGRAEARAERLDRKGAIREVARMLGGERISDLTLRHAAEMVARGR